MIDLIYSGGVPLAWVTSDDMETVVTLYEAVPGRTPVLLGRVELGWLSSLHLGCLGYDKRAILGFATDLTPRGRELRDAYYAEQRARFGESEPEPRFTPPARPPRQRKPPIVPPEVAERQSTFRQWFWFVVLVSAVVIALMVLL
jgi:hypothetical protein